MTDQPLNRVESDLQEAVALLRAAVTDRDQNDAATKTALAQINERIDALTDQQNAILKAQRSPAPAPNSDERHAKAREGMIAYLRRGDAALTPAHHEAFDLLRKDLSVDSDPDGGYLVTPAQSARIITTVADLSPLRGLATIETIGTDALEGLADEEDFTVGWVGERASRTKTDTARLGMWRIPVHEQYAAPHATQKLLDDANVDVEAWINRKVATRFAEVEGAAFVTGDGSGKPRGFTTYPAGTTRGKIEQVNTGAATAVAPAGIVNIVYKLKSAYLNGAAWLMNRTTLGSIRGLRGDGGGGAGTGDFLWQPGFGGQPSTLMGYPIFEEPNLASEGSGNLVAAFGNVRAAYTIVDRAGIRILRDPYTAKPFVEFYATRRLGGDVVNFEAIKLLKCSA